MAGLVDGDRPLLVVGKYLVAFFQTAYHAVDGGVEVLSAHVLLVVTCGDERGFVAHVGYVGAREARSLACQKLDVEVGGGLYLAQVHLEYLHAVGQVGQVDVYLSVETSGAHEGLVEDVGAVGGGEDYHAAVGAEAVHLRKQLVESVLALVVGAHAGVASAGAAHGVDFVDEHYARRLLLGLAEEVAHARGAHAYEHLHEVGTRHGEERHVGLAGHSLGKQRLARAGRAYQERTLGYLAAEVGVALGIFEEFDYLLNLGLGLAKAGYVAEGHFVGVVLVEEHGLRLAHAEYASGTSGIFRRRRCSCGA